MTGLRLERDVGSRDGFEVRSVVNDLAVAGPTA